MSYSLTASGDAETVISSLLEQVQNTPKEQQLAAADAHVMTSLAGRFWEELFGEDTEESDFKVQISGHKQTPGTAKGFVNIRIEIL